MEINLFHLMCKQSNTSHKKVPSSFLLEVMLIMTLKCLNRSINGKDFLFFPLILLFSSGRVAVNGDDGDRIKRIVLGLDIVASNRERDTPNKNDKWKKRCIEKKN